LTAVINQEPTPADERSELLIRDDVAKVFGELMNSVELR